MNHLQIWCGLKSGVTAEAFAASVRDLLGFLHERELIESYALLQRAFTITPPELAEFQMTIDFADLGQLNRAFEFISEEECAARHADLQQMVRNVSVAMYRDLSEKPKNQKAETPK